MTNNHTDQLDGRLEQVHRVFMDDHDALRQDLLDRLDDAPADLPVGAIPLTPSTKRKWIMRSSIGLAAALTIAAIIGISLFGSGPTSPAIAWADVKENIENATAMFGVRQMVVLDADGNPFQEPIGRTDTWEIRDGRSRTLNYGPDGKPQREMIIGPDGSLHLSYATKHASHTLTRFYPPKKPDEGAKQVDASPPSDPLDMILRLSDRYAKRVGPEKIDGQATDLFEVTMEHLVAFHVEQSGQAPKLDSIFGTSIEEFVKLPPMRLWVGQESGLPVRVEMPVHPDVFGGRVKVPEGGRIVARVDGLVWNDRVDPEVFEQRIPEGWALDRSELVLIGEDAAPNDPELVMSGLPLAEGVRFRVRDGGGKAVLTEADLVAVTRVSRRTGYLKGGDEDEWDKLAITFTFTEGWRERLDGTLGEGESAQWAFQLGALSGTVRARYRDVTDGELSFKGVWLDEFVIDKADADLVLKLLDTGE
ncbi:MAG: hypothetical protein AAGB26_12860 [Planctomycetota bacterium]